MDLPTDDALRWLVRTYARIRAHHGDGIGAPVLVQPNGEFFPDAFRFDAPSVATLLRRMIHYAPISDDLGTELAFVEAEDNHAGGCGSLACSTSGPGGARAAPVQQVHEIADGYRIVVATTDVANADVLTASLGRAVGTLVLHEAGEEADPKTGEMAAVVCGFGVLLANGAAAWAKACGGLRMARATILSVEELGVGLALFIAIHGCKAPQARANLGATQREALDQALDWVDSNPLLVETLRDRPALLDAGAFDMEPVRGALGRWLHKRNLDKALRAAPVAAAAPMTDEKKRRLAEARALVDEVMGPSGS